MEKELLSSKLFIPPLRPSLVARPRLILGLNKGLHERRKLTLISAPAGFGKTTLVIDWLRQTALPTAWLSLEETDNNLPRFLAYVGAAFQQIDEEIGAQLRSAIQTPQLPAVEQLLTVLINEIANRTDPLLLVLDDLHLITDPSVLQALQFLLQHQPAPLHIVLITREDPDLPFAKLRARDQLTELRARDLRFTREEADIFLRDVMGLALSEQDVAALEDRTEGWAVGLQLAGLSMQKQAELKAFIAEFSGSHRHILDYLTDEVLQQQPENIRAFLLQTSILERLTGSLCNVLTGRQDGDKVLAQLETANLFIIPLDEERRWYRYHHLFSDLLRSQLVRTRPKSIPELHRRASEWYAEHGETQPAIDHALQSMDLTLAASLIEQYTFPKLYQGQIAVVLDWFERLPDEVIDSAPMLCIGKAWALALMQRGTHQGKVDQALGTARRALDRVNAGAELRNLVDGYSASLRAFLLRAPWREETREKLIALSQEAQRLLPVEERAIRSINDLNIGYAYLGMGDMQAAKPAFEQALEEGLAGRNYYAAIYGPINLILSKLMVGRGSEALQLCEANIDRFNQALAGQYFPPIGALYILKGNILLEQNKLQQAEELLTEGLDLIRWTGESVAHRTGYQGLARIRASRADSSGMAEALKTLEKSLPRDALYAQALRHRLSLRYWSEDSHVQVEAREWLAQSKIEFDTLEVVRSLNPSSAATFESHIHAADVLTRLARATPGAYALDGVQAYLQRQMEFAQGHGITSWVVTIALAQSQLYEAAGKRSEAVDTLSMALETAAPTGLFRIFIEECDSLQPLLERLKPRLRNPSLVAYAGRLLEAFGGVVDQTEPEQTPVGLLSAREIDVLQNLARGLSYEEIGQQLFLSLNTIQSHVKSIYRKLLVNKRVHAIEKGRELRLI
jgi:LuxR family maltose regulon positive regulatory protein